MVPTEDAHLWSRGEAPFMIGGAGSQDRICRNMMRDKDRGRAGVMGRLRTAKNRSDTKIARVSRMRIVPTRTERGIDVKAPVQQRS